MKKRLADEWNVPPWEMHKLMASDLQDVRLAAHVEAYSKQEQRERARGESSGSVSRKHYDTNKSRQKAFGGA